ncbi:ATP-binding cassette domain-containing protein [Sunxiuqinia sp. sy24]|uniref:ATP-binding cassette domain-containing protein n=1 Tax=Sunxiuqinia sp. sy24 TaxID=3461495 RepID=UPI0040460A17
MYEGIIETLIRLFAIITDYHDEESKQNSSDLVGSFLHENFNRELVEIYHKHYLEFVEHYHITNRDILYEKHGSGQKFINKGYLNQICDDIVGQFDLGTRFMIVAQLLNFIKKEDGFTLDDLKTVNLVSRGLKINAKEYDSLYRFHLYSIQKVKDKSSLFVVNGNEAYHDKEIKHLYRENQQVELELIRIASINTLFFKYWGPRNLYMNGHRLMQHRLYVFPPGAILKTSRIIPIYYSSVMTRFIQEKGKARIVLNVENIEYRFSRKNYGLHPLSFQERSGDLVGILGGSGVGKTTLLNVLNGKLKPNNGTISINGYDLHDPRNEEMLKGVIGYVPQDDLLLEELTVYKNLEFNARFCFGDMTEEQIEAKIDQALNDFDLVEARDLVVGSPLKKILSGGQRKRLNIALELMREPAILFVDEPTSGLSSADSEKVMFLLKKQCLKGRLVFANIHQPSSDIYKLFDRMIVMDKGGRVVFFGNPMDAITYFKNQASYINPDESECLSCGNVKTEQPLRIIETRMVNPFGKSIRRRKISPEDWYERYKKHVEPRVIDFMKTNPAEKEVFPDVHFKIPDWFKQLKLFVKRDFETKRSNKQYLAIALLEAPILALILGFFSKFSADETYWLSNNDNLPAFLFMSVVVALFIGLSISAEEIFKDRRILKREEFLNLSRGAYISSKILMLFLISAIQVLSFVLIGHYMLEIRDLTFSNWAILFSTACFANLLGLNLSAGLNSAVAIYILIPLMLVPQLLLSGVIIDFNKMHASLSSYDRTPLIGDVMVSRWSYEALAVNQFENNAYREVLFCEEQEKNDLGFKAFYWVPEVDKYLEAYQLLAKANKLEDASKLVPVLKNSFGDLLEVIEPQNDSVRLAYAALGGADFNLNFARLLGNYLHLSQESYKHDYGEKSRALEQKYEELGNRFGGDKDKLNAFRKRYANKKLEALVRDKYSTYKTYLFNDRIYQGDEPIFRKPVHDNGAAHFYASYKLIGNWRIDTILFNIGVMWLFTFVLMIALYFDVLHKALTYVENLRLARQARMRDNIFYNPMAFMKGDRKK